MEIGYVTNLEGFLRDYYKNNPGVEIKKVDKRIQVIYVERNFVDFGHVVFEMEEVNSDYINLWITHSNFRIEKHELKDIEELYVMEIILYCSD